MGFEQLTNFYYNSSESGDYRQVLAVIRDLARDGIAYLVCANPFFKDEVAVWRKNLIKSEESLRRNLKQKNHHA